VTSAEDGAGWLAFFRGLTARGLTGLALVTSDAHTGLTAAIGATLGGAAWQRCRTHYAANLMAITPKSSWGWVKAMLPSIYDQPDAEAVHAQFDRVIATLADKLPTVVEHLEDARADILAFTCFPKEIWRQIWSNNPSERLSTARSAAAPTSSAFSPTAVRSSASSVPCSSSNTTSGPRAAATSAWRSSNVPASPSSTPTTPTNPRRRQSR
jgi:transposase-like protein